MRFVVDNNQLSDIRKTTRLTLAQKQRITLVLPPFVWVEATLYGVDNLRCLLDYDVRFGRDVGDVLHDAATVSDDQWRSVEAVILPESQLHRDRLSRLKTAPAWHRTRAAEIKQGNRDDMKRTRDAFGGETLPELRKELDSLADAIDALEPDLRRAPFRPDGDETAPARSWWELLHCGHAGIRNFTKYHLCLYVAYHKSWKDDALNSAPPVKQDHIPDISLAIYANPGDIILTADKQFERLFRMVDPTGRILVITWAECQKNVL